MSGELQIVVRGDDLTDQDRAGIARDLGRLITKNVPGSQVHAPVAGAPKPGQKGVEVVAGTLALVLTTGTAKALVDCIATYIRERRRSVKLEVSGTSGARVTLAADNVGKAELDRLVTQLGSMAQAPSSPAKS